MIKAGILGGGQLGRMLLQSAANYPVETFVIENDEECPAARLCHHFIKGNITNYEDVYRFGKMVDVLTIEIENVSVEALEALENEEFQINTQAEIWLCQYYFWSQLCPYGIIYQIRQHIFKHEQRIIKFSSSIRTSADIFS